MNAIRRTVRPRRPGLLSGTVRVPKVAIPAAAAVYLALLAVALD